MDKIFYIYIGGTVVLVVISSGLVYVGSESREAARTVNRLTNEFISDRIVREPNKPTKYPGLNREKVGKKIHVCEDFIIAGAGNAKASENICTGLIEFNKQNANITLENLIDYIKGKIDKLPMDEPSPAFLLITPDVYSDYCFTITEISASGDRNIYDTYALLGCGKKEAEECLLEDGPNAWIGKTKDEIRCFVRDCIYKSAETHTLTVGGTVVVYTAKVVKNTDGKLILDTERKVKFPSPKNVFTKTLLEADMTYGLQIDKKWFEDHVFLHWEPNAKELIVKPGTEITTSARFYTEVVEDNDFYKRPISADDDDGVKPYKKYKMTLRNVSGINGSFVLGFKKLEDFRRICSNNNIQPGFKVYIFWENEAATFTLWFNRAK